MDIEGTIDSSGGMGARQSTNPFLRVPAVPGSGGYGGGVGGNNVQAAFPGNGPGGGAEGTLSNGGIGRGGTFSGNQFLIPLVGGSGGGGGLNAFPPFCDGGGAGGGALLIASSSQIVVNGRIDAGGGAAGEFCGAGGGSGGAVRLVSNTISGAGGINASGGTGCSACFAGGPGIVRLEATSLSFVGSVQGTLTESTPFPLLLPTAGPPFAKVISINGVAINPNPATFPDITVNTTSAIPVVIQTHNIPTTATINLTILDENGVADTVIAAPPLGSCDPDNFCTTTLNVIFPFGASRGLTKVTWTQ